MRERERENLHGLLKDSLVNIRRPDTGHAKGEHQNTAESGAVRLHWESPDPMEPRGFPPATRQWEIEEREREIFSCFFLTADLCSTYKWRGSLVLRSLYGDSKPRWKSTWRVVIRLRTQAWDSYWLKERGQLTWRSTKRRHHRGSTRFTAIGLSSTTCHSCSMSARGPLVSVNNKVKWHNLLLKIVSVNTASK